MGAQGDFLSCIFILVYQSRGSEVSMGKLDRWSLGCLTVSRSILVHPLTREQVCNLLKPHIQTDSDLHIFPRESEQLVTC